ncbi:MAG: VOC family protein [Chloroflexi bacterium]|nr:MAG: VOC family protein [Chloroflexota bacterium]
MENIKIELEGVTIAPINVAAMVHYYNVVFAANLEPFAAFGTTLYRGQLARLRLIFCPNDFLNIQAEKNRQQFSFGVSDVTAVVQKSITAGGQGEVHESEQGYTGTLHDPDGNSIEISEL